MMTPYQIVSVLHGMSQIPEDLDEVIAMVEEIERAPEQYLNTGQACRGYDQLKAIAWGEPL